MNRKCTLCYNVRKKQTEERPKMHECVCFMYACIQTGRQSWWMLEKGGEMCRDRLIRAEKKQSRGIKVEGEENGDQTEEGRKY